MLEKFAAYIKSNDLIRSEDTLLLAVSGGIDSVTMTHLFYKSGFSFDLAHCNFMLRGSESDEDQNFVRKLAEKYECKFYSRNFDTKKYARENNMSVQMAARQLRYGWFDKLARQHNYSCIAIAHNRNDIVETILMNLFRGTGLKGLTGIKARQEHIIRPILFASRKEIQRYAEKEKLSYREDSSNNETKYHRNLIRREIIPLIEQINPSFTNTLLEESEVFQAAFSLYQHKLSDIRKAITIPDKHSIIFSIPKIVSLRLSAPIIYDLISGYGFSYTDSKNLLGILNSEPGKRFISTDYIMLKDRKTIIIEKTGKPEPVNEYYIDINTHTISVPVKLKISNLVKNESFTIPESAKIASIDYNKLVFPLKIRHWKRGDGFVPLGMKGRKKLSDFFIDRKINLLEKDKVWLLLSGKAIVWVVGYQIDDRFKVTAETKKILHIELIN